MRGKTKNVNPIFFGFTLFLSEKTGVKNGTEKTEQRGGGAGEKTILAHGTAHDCLYGIAGALQRARPCAVDISFVGSADLLCLRPVS